MKILQKKIFENWNLKYFIILLFGAAIYLKLWSSFALTANIFDDLDYGLFYFLNNLLHNDLWSFFCAILNTRYVDLISGLTLLSIAIAFVLHGGKYCILRRIIMFASISVFIMFSSYLSQYFFLGVERISPTREHFGGSKYMRRRIMTKMEKKGIKMNIVFINHKHKNIKTKDGSNITFPSDHGIVLFAFFIGIFFYSGMKLGFISLFISILFSIPRLLSGAHFITDTIVGTFVVLLISTAIFYTTPLHIYVIKILRVIIHKLLHKKILKLLRKAKSFSQLKK